MENFAFNNGFIANSNGAAVVSQQQQSAPLWRPWTGTNNAVTHRAVRDDTSDSTLLKPCLQVVHPVKLFWPKSKCYDYLYQDAEQLLRNYPVQAAICPYDDSSSDEESDYDEDYDEEEEEEMKMEIHCKD